MNGAEVHLALNHIPVFGSAFGALFLLVSVLRKNRGLQQAGLWLCLVAAVAAVPTYLTGEPAEDAVERLAGVDETRIEEHEEAALWALIGIETMGVAAAAALYLEQKSGQPPVRLIQACLILALVALAIVGRTAQLGGQIHHPEVRSGFQATAP